MSYIQSGKEMLKLRISKFFVYSALFSMAIALILIIFVMTKAIIGGQSWSQFCIFISYLFSYWPFLSIFFKFKKFNIVVFTCSFLVL